MKIGIFGDSFATDYDGDSAWVNLLKADYDVTTHAWGGTGIDWSYYQFLEHHTKYDKIIFVVSSLFRNTVFGVSDTVELPIFDNGMFNRLTTAEQLKLITPAFSFGLFDGYKHTTLHHNIFSNEEYSVTDDAYCDALEDIHADYPLTNYVMHHSMTTAIKHIHDNVTLISAFSEYERNSMINITHIDTQRFKGAEIFGKRFNHMSATQSAEFATYMKRHLSDGFDIVSTLAPESVEHFYTPSTTAKQAGLTS